MRVFQSRNDKASFTSKRNLELLQIDRFRARNNSEIRVPNPRTLYAREFDVSFRVTKDQSPFLKGPVQERKFSQDHKLLQW